MPDPRPLPAAAALALAALSGVLLADAYALEPHAWLAWLAPAPLLAAAVRGSRVRAAWLGRLAGVIAAAGFAPYLLLVANPAVALGVTLARALFWGAAAALTARAARRLPAALAVLVLPTLAAAIEALVLALSPHGSAGSLGYSQMGIAPLAGLAALGGLPLVVFVLLAIGSALGLAGARLLGAPLRLAPALAVVGVLLAGAFAHGGWRPAPPSGPAVRVVALASDRTAREAPWQAVWPAYAAALGRSAPGAALAVLPEKLALLDSAGLAAARADLAAAARRTGAVIVAGVELREGGAYRNLALVVRPDGTGARYAKQHLVPGFEDRETPGHAALLLPFAGHRLGIAICKDMHFPAIGRSYAAAAVMAVPAWDFGRDGGMAARMTALRGIENGYAVVRAAREGLASVSDGTGRFLAVAPSGPGMAVAAAMLPLARPGPTPYARWGEWFGWLCGAATLALLWLTLRR